MMAKMFYRFEEAKQVLSMSDEQLKQLTREGKLREFRDGAQVMYKADQVDSLRGELGLGDAVELGPSDTAGPIGMADTRSNTASGSVISLADSSSKEDTAMDLGLSGGSDGGSGSGTGLAMSMPGNTGSGIDLAGATGTGVPLASGTHTGTAMGGTAMGGTAMGVGSIGGTRSGVSVLGLDEGGNADPSAQTAMGGSFGGEPSLDAMGSGSGLLDLSRERDDTSLGAPVLDEISGTGRMGASGSSMGLGGSGPISNAPLTGAGPASAAARAGSVPIYVEASDNFTGFAAGASFGVAVLCVIALYAVAAAASHAQPTLLGFLFKGGDGSKRAALPMLYVFGGGALLTIVAGLIGFVVGKKK